MNTNQQSNGISGDGKKKRKEPRSFITSQLSDFVPVRLNPDDEAVTFIPHDTITLHRGDSAPSAILQKQAPSATKDYKKGVTSTEDPKDSQADNPQCHLQRSTRAAALYSNESGSTSGAVEMDATPSEGKQGSEMRSLATTLLDNTASNVQDLQTGVQHVQTNVQNLQTDIQHVQANVQHLQSDIQHVLTSVQHVQTGIRYVQTSVRHFQTDTRHLQADIEHLQAAIRRLQTTLDAKLLLTRLAMVAGFMACLSILMGARDVGIPGQGVVPFLGPAIV
ncbi:hypothetical protein BKA70DRAFT_1446482 [Coprinopsis sp. MPI-PUGE-AT-0042]|nr:hypothetical protein BKA70DRAFT_1446482 [Coprinopsis sp. MPI-PUGE-AT-0042]